MIVPSCKLMFLTLLSLIFLQFNINSLSLIRVVRIVKKNYFFLIRQVSNKRLGAGEAGAYGTTL